MRYSTVYPFRLRGKSITCVYCCEGYDDPTHFRRHIDVQHKQFTVATAFHHMSSLKEYLKCDITNLKCRLCYHPCEKIEDFTEHFKTKHIKTHGDVVKKLKLEYDVGLQPYRLVNNNYCCYHCGKKMPTLIKLCRHTIVHYQRFTCDTCGRNYLSHEALKYHIKCIHEVTKHVCRKCWKEFPTSEMKKEHVRGSKPCWTFCCTICGERFQSWEQKQKHLQAEHDFEKIVYNCPDCEEKFTSRKYFYTHYKLAHTDEGFQCACCGLKFNTQKRLDDHSLGHTGEKQFICTICAKSFVRRKSLNQHMWTHSETKRFVCLLCDKQFAQKVSLKTHMRSTHPDVSIDV